MHARGHGDDGKDRVINSKGEGVWGVFVMATKWLNTI
jgi:hypothetical protein